MEPKAVREALGLNVSQMARLCGIHYMTWSKWEKCEQRPPAIARRMFDFLLWLNREGLLEQAARDLDQVGLQSTGTQNLGPMETGTSLATGGEGGKIALASPTAHPFLLEDP